MVILIISQNHRIDHWIRKRNSSPDYSEPVFKKEKQSKSQLSQHIWNTY